MKLKQEIISLILFQASKKHSIIILPKENIINKLIPSLMLYVFWDLGFQKKTHYEEIIWCDHTIQTLQFQVH